MSHKPSPPPAVCPNWLPLWNHPLAGPRPRGPALCAISPSVANATKVAARLPHSTRPASSGTVAARIGVAVMPTSTAPITAIAMRYHVLRDSE